jgi:hypothetical protein
MSENRGHLADIFRLDIQISDDRIIKTCALLCILLYIFLFDARQWERPSCGDAGYGFDSASASNMN